MILRKLLTIACTTCAMATILSACGQSTTDNQIIPTVQAVNSTNSQDNIEQIPEFNTDITYTDTGLDIEESIMQDTPSDTVPTTEYTEPIETEPIPEPLPIALSLDVRNVKGDYSWREEFSLDGLLVYVVYDNGDEIPVSLDACDITLGDTNKVGEQEVIISYNGLEMHYGINVHYDISDVTNTKQYTQTALNLRNGPSTDFDIMTTVAINTELTILGKVDTTEWYKVQYNGAEYFCAAKYVDTTKVVIQAPVSTPSSSNSNAGSGNSSGYVEDTTDYGSFITGESGASSSVVRAANKFWTNNVPGWLKQLTKDNGWRIMVSGTPLNKRFGYSGSIAGITVGESNIIYLDNRESIIRTTLLHELGHMVDDIYGYPSCTDEFIDIFYAERGSFADKLGVGDGHHKSNELEYFAEVFQDIILLGKNSIGNIPDTYDFVSSYMG